MMDLALDTCTKNISVSIGDGFLKKTYVSNCSEKQNLFLIKIFNKIFKELNIKIGDIKNYYFTTGPGSFTGIRCGISFLMGLTEGRDVKYFPISTLCAISLSEEGLSTSILPQYKNFYFFGIYNIKNTIKEIIPPSIIKFEKIDKISRGKIIKFEELKTPLSEIIFNKRNLIKEKKQPIKPLYIKNPYET